MPDIAVVPLFSKGWPFGLLALAVLAALVWYIDQHLDK